MTTSEHSRRRPAAAPRDELAPFLIGLALFAAVAFLGWRNLPYGFNFADEGMYMTDAWRMTVGDRLFPDNATSVLRLYVVFNAAVFEVAPGITLLGFRELQFVLTLLAVVFLGAALYRWTGRYAGLPYVMSLYAFTGLHVKGMVANLSYHTYPHLFFTLYVACLLFGLKSECPRPRAAWLIAAGTCLWAIGFSLLPLAAGAVAPVACWAALRWLRADDPRFTARDLAWVLGPVVALWLAFLAVYGSSFFVALATMVGYMGEHKSHAFGLDRPAWGYVALGGVFLLAFRAIRRLRGVAAAGAAAVASAVMGWVVGTNAGGIVPPYWRGYFSLPMWLGGVLIAFVLVFLGGALAERVRRGACVDHAGLPLIVVPQLAILAAIFSQVSDSHALAVTYLAIPGTATLGVYLLERMRPAAHAAVRVSFLVAFLLPLYGWTAWADHRFTHDLAPEQLSYTIPDGFAAGIVTNPSFGAMVQWITRTARAHTREGDFAIFMDMAPMGHMLTRLRPALNHSWIGLAYSKRLRADAVAAMERAGRRPRVAYRFIRGPYLFALPQDPDRYVGEGLVPYAADDPISGYLATQMRLVQRFRVQGVPWIELYVAPDAADDSATGPDPPPRPGTR